jgi:tripeptide aminopeptidase
MSAPFTSPLAEELAEDVLERFCRYVRVETTAVVDTEDVPSSPGQLELGRMLVAELQELGLTDVTQDEMGFVFGTLATNQEGEQPTIGWLAHMDTSPDAPGRGVEPIVHRGYDGSVLTLPKGAVLDPEKERALASRTGHDIVTSSGDTLLGADDKAGVAEIMGAVAYLSRHPELPRPNVRVGFTIDEEVGRGAFKFDIERFGAQCAYTMDGSDLGELEEETFSALGATVSFEGVDIHPGSAYGVLVNATRLAGQLLAALPSDRLTPETTREREGFIHPHRISGDIRRTTVEFILRDFDDELLQGHAELVRTTAQQVADATPGARVEVQIAEQYPNMKRFLADHPQVVAKAAAAIEAEGVEIIRSAARGGTDGSILSARGLPTPNIFAGGHAFHSVREWVSVQDMAAASAVLVRLAAEWTTD